jgi:hypothetical protein
MIQASLRAAAHRRLSTAAFSNMQTTLILDGAAVSRRIMNAIVQLANAILR